MPDSSSNDYIGRGWSFPLRLTVQGGIHLSGDLHNLEESIRIILKTNLGERVYRPNFGSRLSELAFAPMNAQTLRRIRLYVREAIERWEPRVELMGIVTEPDPMRGRVDIAVDYRPKGDYERRSMVYPFYLLPAGEES